MPLYLFAQLNQPLSSVKIVKPVSTSLDRKGNVYISDEEGNINRYTSEGELDLNYSPSKIGKVDVLEGWFSLRLFAFYRDYQEYLFLDRFLTPSPVYKIPQDLIGFARIATLANDDNIWIVDDIDISLKKLDTNTPFLLYNIQLNTVLDLDDHDMNFMREYQNQLFINNGLDGIMVFDNLGNYKYKIPIKGLEFFSFTKDELVYFSEGNLVFTNIYSQKKRSIRIDSDTPYHYALISENRLFLLSDDQMDVFPNPN